MAKAKTTVEYRDLPGHPGYRVGSDGSVWSCRGIGRGIILTDKWRRLKPQKSAKRPSVPGRYLCVGLHTTRGQRMHGIHRLVLLAFVGPCPPGMEARHFPDRNPANNRLENLQWGTPTENQLDKRHHGTHLGGERNPGVKLTSTAAQAIRAEYIRLKAGRLRLPKGTVVALAAKYDICKKTIRNIGSGHSWFCLKPTANAG